MIYRYKQSSEDEIDACTQLSQLPTTITGLQAFMNGFRPSTEGGDIWGSLRIGIDTPAADFLDNVAQEAFMRKFWVRAAPLQVADSDNAGWLYLSTEHLDPITTADSINTFIARYCARKGRTPFTVACERRMIWDDKAGANSKLSVKERNAKKAMHIVCEKGRQQDTAAFVRGWLKSKVGRAFTNLPMKFIPNFSKGQGIAYTSKFSHAVQKHMNDVLRPTRKMSPHRARIRRRRGVQHIGQGQPAKTHPALLHPVSSCWNLHKAPVSTDEEFSDSRNHHLYNGHSCPS